MSGNVFAGGITPTIKPGTSIVPAMLASSQLSVVAVDDSAGGDITVLSGTALQTIRIFRLFLVAGGATSLTFKDSTPTSFSGAIPLAANSGIILDFSGDPWFTTAVGKGFIVNSSAAVQVAGSVWYAKS